MKRRLLSAFLAVMMVLTMAPVAFAADETNTTSVGSYEDLVNAIASAENGATITLSSDINVTQTIAVKDKAITLNLNGKKLYNEEDLWDKPDKKANNWSLISVRGTGNLTITGNGTLSAKENDCYDVDVQDADASVTIENGTFVGNIHTVYVEHGTAYIKGGSYSIQQTYYPDETKSYEFVLNCLDEARQDYEAKIYVSGGSFEKFNPADCKAEGEGTNFCEEGYTTTQNGDTYTVVAGENAAVANAGANYNTVADAIREAGNGGAVTLLKDVTENVVIPTGKTVTLDLNGKNIKPATGCAIVNKGNLTVTGSGEVLASQTEMAAVANFPDAVINLNGGTYLSKYWYVLKNMGSMTIDGAVTVKPADSGNVSSLIDNGWYYPTDKVAGESVPAQADKASLTIKNGDFSGKSGEKSCSVVKNDDYGVLNISGGTFDSTTNTNATNAATILNWNIATISGGIFKGQYPISNGAFANAADKGEITISGGTFTGSKTLFGYGKDGNGVGKITITYGNFAAPAFGDWGSAYTMEISGGYFTVDPSAYCVTGKTGVKSDKDGYKYKVGTIEVKDENKIQTGAKVGDTKADASAIAEDKRPAAKAVGASVTSTTLTDTTPITADDKAQALTELVKNKKVILESDGTIPKNTTVTVVKKTYLDVTVTAYDTTSDTVSMDIVPKYDLIAVAKNSNSAAEQIVLKSAQDAKVGSTEVEVTLPNKFKGRKVYINHNNGANLYVATANETTGKVKFTTNGFSPFTFALSNPNVVAEVNGNAYTSFADAVSAVPANGTIEITGGTSPYTGTANKTFTVKNSTSADITVNGQTIKPTKSYTFKYTHSSGSSSGGSSSGKTTYKVTTSAVNNGGVNASPSNAEKGATITITLSPDKGYKLDKLTVTDGSGKSVSTVKKSDTVYTFTMPASAVTVGVSYAKADETPSKTTFNDVSANDWFASAVDYVTGKGMMNGTAANTFSPKANTTRGMLMTVLARHAGEDTTGGSVWYEKGMNWAKANGVSDGTNPQVNITREQLAAMLYRYAQNKKYDVSGAKSLDGYTDAQSVSSYAVPALQWANAAGVVNGKSGSKLDPKGYATRAEVAAMLMRFCENVEK
ncbi:S-layer homology domain-containing protein [Butyricicoccus sp. AM27-36]|uniref:S-layer homology domain-containing protein n=1 Tax=Butyricicoccus sp. AM27-36 TaxID=2292293 RepID=UPI001FAA9631|nr:S-layer homology domain-containing protein [Butyricicoccus sp. AM27-36]